MSGLRIAILAHSTSPRGGVVHALELGDALTRLGHEAVVHAPDPHGAGFFRSTLCETRPLPASPVGPDTAAMVHARVGDYLRYFETGANRGFDIFHAQDSISGNALAAMKQSGVVGSLARTVHHIDHFFDPRLTALQHHAITAADTHFVVSRHWQEHLARELGIHAHLVGNGVDLARFTAAPQPGDAALRKRLGLATGPVFLSVGGIEQRKNTLRILQAFQSLRASHPHAQLLIAGGASLLDHRGYQQEFYAALTASGLPAHAVIVTGPLPQADMPALYRIADALVFPSVKEGFGLVVLEAMASHTPVITSRIAPFTEYLGKDDVIWCDPLDAASIAAAMAQVLQPECRPKLIQNGARVAARHDWQTTAQAHLTVYARMKDLTHA
jgi:glycosyltransferase-like protein